VAYRSKCDQLLVAVFFRDNPPHFHKVFCRVESPHSRRFEEMNRTVPMRARERVFDKAVFIKN
jgi:hypothetical protein